MKKNDLLEVMTAKVNLPPVKMPSRNLTLSEINDIVIPRISAHYKKIGRQQKHNDQIRKFLIDRSVLSNVVPELTQILFESSDQPPEQIIKVVTDYLNTLSQGDANLAIQLQTILNTPLTLEQRIIEATTALSQIAVSSQFEEMWQDALNISEFDVMETIPFYLQHLGPDHPFYADLYHIYTQNTDDFLTLVAHLDFWIDNQQELIQDPTLLSNLEELRDLIKWRRGPLVGQIRQRKLLQLIDDNLSLPTVRQILVDELPAPVIQLGRLTEFIQNQQLVDVPLWLSQLLSGNVSILNRTRKMYDALRDRVGDNPEITISGYLMKTIKIPQKLLADVQEFDAFLDNDQDERLSVMETVQRYIESVGNQHPENFDKAALVHILETFHQEDQVDANDQLIAIRGVLQNQQIIDNDLEGFIEKYLTNIPRKLTRAEIDDILVSVPMPIGDVDVASSIWNAMVYKLRKQLEIFDITPLAIPELKQMVRRQAYAARVSANSTVGAQAAAAMGATVTQMTLNSFHSSGSALNMTSGIERMKQLIKFPKDKKDKSHVNTSCKVYFNQRVPFDVARRAIMDKNWDIMKMIGWNFEEVINKREAIVGITVKDLLINDPEIDRTTSLLAERPWWYDIHELSYGTRTPDSNWVLRLKLNPVKMFKYRITMEEVVNVITTGTWYERSSLNKVHGIDLIWSPDNVGLSEQGMTVPVIDIFPRESELNAVLKEADFSETNNAFMFLSKVISPSFGGIRVKGIEGIHEAFPASFKIWNAVEFTKLVEDRIWDIQVKQRSAIFQGVNNLFVARLCSVVGLEIIEIYDNLVTIRVRVPEEMENDPKKIVLAAIEEDDSASIDYQQEKLQKKEIPSRRPATAVEIAASHYFIETLGDNLYDLMNIDDVDESRTHSNSHKEDYYVLGIEAGRNRLVQELFNVLASGGDLPINSRHIMLLADSMCRTGNIIALSYHTLPQQGQGFLTRSAFEQPISVIANAAIIGESEEIGEPGVNGGISAAIFLGKEARMGAGAIDIEVDRSKLRTFAQHAGGMVYDETAFADIVKNHRLQSHVDDLVTGMDTDFPEDGEYETFQDTEKVVDKNQEPLPFAATPATIVDRDVPGASQLPLAVGPGNIRGAEQKLVAEEMTSSCPLPAIPGMRR